MQNTCPEQSVVVTRLTVAFRIILFLVVLLIILAFSIHKIENRDFGWQLKTGEHIWETHRVPREDPFSYTAEGNKYIDSHWLFQVLLFASYKVLGIAGPGLFMAGILLATFLITYSIGHQPGKYVITCVLIIAAVVVASERFLVRPHLVTLLFLSLYFCILERYRHGRSRGLFLLPFLQLLWVNMHGLFVLGLILPSIYFIFFLAEGRVAFLRKSTQEQRAPDKGYMWLGIIILVMLFESLLNPYTLDVALYPFTLFKEVRGETNVVAASVAELAPALGGSDLSRAERCFKWMVYLFPLTFLLNLRRVNFIHVCLFSAFLYLALIARRNLDLFAVIATPIAIMNIDGFIDGVAERFRRMRLRYFFGIAQLVVSPVVMVAGFWIIYLVTTDAYFIDDRDLTRFGFGVSRHTYPIKAANLIDAANPTGRMFNDPADGGFLIWRFFPDRKVYFDGRWEVYGNDFFEEFKLVSSNPSRFEDQAARLDMRYAIIPHSIGHMQRILKHMLASPDWTLVYVDELSAVFLRNIPEHAEWIEEHVIELADFESRRAEFEAELPVRLDAAPFTGMNSFLVRMTGSIPRRDYPFEQLARAHFYFKLGLYDNAQSLYEKALRMYPDSEIAHSSLGIIYWKKGLYSFALAEFEAADQLNPRNVVNLMNLARISTAMGKLGTAEQYFKRAKRADSKNAAAPLELGRLLLMQGRNDEAVRELERALKLNPDLEEARELLRRIESGGTEAAGQ
jgi:tetratricopeptide (TPR) repeat protein